MDFVVRRQSEQLNRRHFTGPLGEDDDNNKPNNTEFREIDDNRRWEWSNLRVNLHFFFLAKISNFFFTFNPLFF